MGAGLYRSDCTETKTDHFYMWHVCLLIYMCAYMVWALYMGLFFVNPLYIGSNTIEQMFL